MTESVPLGYTLFAVLAGPRPRTAPGDAALAELESVVAGLAADGVTLRGFYDVTGMRAEADLMVWLHTTPGSVDDPAQLQQALRALRRTTALAAFENVWSAMGVHREAEFNKRHVPGYLRGEHARGVDRLAVEVGPGEFSHGRSIPPVGDQASRTLLRWGA